jgi:hypothetical protein
MGRGRAKAKQTKVARELKYSSHGTDLNALQAELAGERQPGIDSHVLPEDELEDDDPYAEYAYDDEDDEDEASERR